MKIRKCKYTHLFNTTILSKTGKRKEKKKKGEKILIPGAYKPDQRPETRRTHKFSVQIKTPNQYSFSKTQTQQNPHG
jgi:hypothetical protein